MKRLFLLTIVLFVFLTLVAAVDDKTDKAIINFIVENNVGGLDKLITNEKIGINYKIDNSTILFIACEMGKSDAAAYLLEKGADVNFKNKNNLTPLMIASQKGYLQVINILIKYKADINLSTDQYKTTALMFACDKGHKDAALLLIEKGADVNMQNLNGGTALMLACMQGFTGVVELLLKNGADVNAKDAYGNSAMSFAVRFEYKNIIVLLKEYGAEEEIIRH